MDIRMEQIISSCLVWLLIATTLVEAQRRGECCQEYCYDLDNERPQSAHFGSKTAYLIAKGPENGRQYLVPNCSPTKMWIYARHGTRLPDKKGIKRLRQLEDLRSEIITNYEKRHSKPAIGAMCENDLNLLKQWHWNQNITEEYGDFLTVQGWEELKFTAIRLQRNFPNILESSYDRSKFVFRYTNTQRTEASFKAFVEGLFGPNAHEYVFVQPAPINDTLLRPYDYCPAYNNQKSKDDGTEYAKFLKSQTIMQLVSDVSQRLGYKFPLKSQQVLDMYDMCRFDQAWTLDRPSPWCAAFTPTQIDDIEYLEDLDKYFASGYARKINSRMACAAVNDMLSNLDNNNQPKAVAYFAHSKSVLLLLTALQAHRDSDSLRADNFYSMSRRKWRMSEISPFATNLAVVKYDCPNEVEREKVMFFQNEKPLYFDWCKVGLCSLREVKERYRDYTQVNCNDYYCTGANGASTLSAYVSVILSSLIAYTFICLAA